MQAPHEIRYTLQVFVSINITIATGVKQQLRKAINRVVAYISIFDMALYYHIFLETARFIVSPT